VGIKHEQQVQQATLGPAQPIVLGSSWAEMIEFTHQEMDRGTQAIENGSIEAAFIVCPKDCLK
jgi:hypothetical protein